MQPEFLMELFKLCRENKIHTALDTSGYIFNEKAKKVLDLVDMVLLDIKHINPEKYKILTSVELDNTLKFAKYLDEIGKPTWIRQVLVPGYTDNEEDLENLRDFLMTLNNIENVEILPYKDFGKYKWEEMGINYPLNGVRLANEEDVRKAKEILQIEKIVNNKKNANS